MKKIFINNLVLVFLLLSIPLVSCGQTINFDEVGGWQGGLLKKINDDFYFKGKPFTGKLVRNYLDTGKLWYSISYKNGKYDGAYENYYKNNKLQSRKSYLLNVRHGEFISYFENGQLEQKMSFSQGKVIDGDCKTYSSDGNLIKLRTFKYGVLNGPYITFNGSYKLAEGVYKENKKDGEWVYYYPESNFVKEKEIYKLGMLDGLYTLYHPLSNVIKIRGLYKDGKSAGAWNSYNERGELIASGEFWEITLFENLGRDPDDVLDF